MPAVFKVFSILRAVGHVRTFLFLVGLMIVAGLLEILGIGSLLPLFHFILAKDAAQLTLYGFKFNLKLLLIGILAIFVLKNLTSFFILYFQTTRVQNLRHSISHRLFKTCLNMPYLSYIEKHTSYFIFLCFGHVNEFSHSYATAVYTLIADVIFLIGIFVFLISLSPMTVLFGGALLLVTSYLFSNLTKKNVIQSGLVREKMGLAMHKTMKEGIEALREVRIFSAVDDFTEKYDRSSKVFSSAHSSGYIIQNSTRLIFEVLMAIFLVAGVFVAKKLSMNSAQLMSTAAVFGLALLRIMPSFNRINGNITLMRSTQPSLEAIWTELNYLKPAKSNQGVSGHVVFTEKLIMKGVYFRYPGKHQYALKDISFEIKKGTRIGVVGKSGAGKSTLVDVLLGILPITQGSIWIDNVSLTQTNQRWRHLIGYVPQTMTLLDDTIKQNIAFGISESEINDQKIAEVINKTQLSEFIRELPQGIDTIIGDRGLRISGGQRQRIAIARALYRDPEILIFDEATSALDMETEHFITKELFNLSADKTMLVIAHRLSTIEQCDSILVMDNGGIIDQGSYKSLLKSNPWFSSLQFLSKKDETSSH